MFFKSSEVAKLTSLLELKHPPFLTAGRVATTTYIHTYIHTYIQA